MTLVNVGVGQTVTVSKITGVGAIRDASWIWV